MPVIRIVLLLIVVGGLALFAFSNLSPVLSLVFLGMQTPVLPLATWMGIAIASGVVTSFLLQFLSFLSMGYSTRRFADSEEVESQKRPFERDYEPPESDRYSPPPPPSAPPTSAASDWEERNGENWDFDQSATSTRQGGNSSSSTRNSQSDVASKEHNADRTTEATPQPPTNSPSGVYSYSYREREQKQAGVGKTDVVYDANYRVIMPPNQVIKPEDDDEDWGFEDDEDFNNDESKNTKKSR